RVLARGAVGCMRPQRVTTRASSRSRQRTQATRRIGRVKLAPPDVRVVASAWSSSSSTVRLMTPLSAKTMLTWFGAACRQLVPVTTLSIRPSGDRPRTMFCRGFAPPRSSAKRPGSERNALSAGCELSWKQPTIRGTLVSVADSRTFLAAARPPLAAIGAKLARSADLATGRATRLSVFTAVPLVTRAAIGAAALAGTVGAREGVGTGAEAVTGAVNGAVAGAVKGPFDSVAFA